MAVGSGGESCPSWRPCLWSPQTLPRALHPHVDVPVQRWQAVDVRICPAGDHQQILPVASEASWIHLRRPSWLLGAGPVNPPYVFWRSYRELQWADDVAVGGFPLQAAGLPGPELRAKDGLSRAPGTGAALRVPLEDGGMELARTIVISTREPERWSRSTGSEWCRLWGPGVVPQLTTGRDK